MVKPVGTVVAPGQSANTGATSKANTKPGLAGFAGGMSRAPAQLTAQSSLIQALGAGAKGRQFATAWAMAAAGALNAADNAHARLLPEDDFAGRELRQLINLIVKPDMKGAAEFVKNHHMEDVASKPMATMLKSGLELQQAYEQHETMETDVRRERKELDAEAAALPKEDDESYNKKHEDYESHRKAVQQKEADVIRDSFSLLEKEKAFQIAIGIRSADYFRKTDE